MTLDSISIKVLKKNSFKPLNKQEKRSDDGRNSVHNHTTNILIHDLYEISQSLLKFNFRLAFFFKWQIRKSLRVIMKTLKKIPQKRKVSADSTTLTYTTPTFRVSQLLVFGL